METVRHRTHGALAVASRVRVLDALRAAGGPLDAGELAQACDLHVSTVRFHLGVLARAGLVHGAVERTGRRGRPRLLYSPAATDGGASGRGGYELLARALAAHWGGPAAERARRAEDAGRAVARSGRLAAPAPAAPAPSIDDAVARLAGMFAELGFDPDVDGDGADRLLRLHACPFRGVAVDHPDVVCSLHLGLMRGALTEMRAPVTATELRPFVEPHLCVARIARP